jgi:hypothetical protein
VREIRTHGSTGRGRKRAHGDDYTGTKPETAETAKSEPTGYRAGPRPYQALAGSLVRLAPTTCHTSDLFGKCPSLL